MVRRLSRLAGISRRHRGPQGSLPGFDAIADWQQDPLDFDLIVLATPLGITAGLLGCSQSARRVA